MASKKKILSAACAVAMILSAFSGMSVVSHAETNEVLVYENLGDSVDGWSGDTSGYLSSLADDGSDDKYLFYTADNRTKTATLDLNVNLTDNYVIDFDTQVNTGNGCGRLAQVLQIAFTGENPVKDTRDYQNSDYIDEVQGITPETPAEGATTVTWDKSGDTKSTALVSNIAASITSRIDLQGDWIINEDGKDTLSIHNGDNVNVGDNKWVRVRAVVNGGKAKITIIDSTNKKYLDGVEFNADATALKQLYLSANRGDANFIPTTTGTISLDNIKIYDASKGTVPELNTVGLRGEAGGEVVIEDAPAITEAEGSTVLSKNDFNSANSGIIISLKQAAQEPVTSYSGLSLGVTTRKDGDDPTTRFEIASENENEKFLSLISGAYTSAGRGPVLSFSDIAELEDGQYIAAKFAAKLVDAKGRVGTTEMVFKDDATVLKTVTTNSAAENAVITESNKWAVYEIKVDDKKNCTITKDGTEIYSGTIAGTTTSIIPSIAGTQENGTNSTVDFDNIVVYTTGKAGEIKEIVAPEVTAPEGAKTIPTVNFNSEESTKTILELNSEEKDLYTDYNGLGLYIGARSEGPGKDYTTWSIAKDYVNDRYLKAYFGEFGGSGRTPTLKFTSEATLTENQILGAKFAAKIIDGESTKGVMTFTEGVPTEKNYEPLATVSTDSSAENAVAAGEWVIYEITVDANKNCVIKAGEKEIYNSQITGNTLPSVSGSNENGTKTAICFDNIVTYTTGEFTQTVAEPAPEIKAPADSITAFEQNLNSFTSKQTLVTIGKEASVSEAVDGLKVTLAGRDDGAGDGTTYASVEKLATGDYVLQIGAGQYSTGGRSPVIDLADAFKGFELDDGDTTVVEFAAKLSDGKNGKGEIVFLASEDTEVGGGEFRHVAGKITTGAEDENVVVSEASKNTDAYTYGVATVQADKWIKVKVEVTKKLGRISEGEVLYPINIYVNDTLVSSSENGRYRYGEDSIATLEGLPKIAFLDSKSGDNYPAPYSTIQLDNFVAYKKVKAAPTDVSMSLSNGGQKVNVKSDASTGTALLVRARYDENGAMTNVKLNTVSLGDGKTATISFDDAQTGDKYILLNGINNLTPLSEAATASIKEAAE